MGRDDGDAVADAVNEFGGDDVHGDLDAEIHSDEQSDLFQRDAVDSMEGQKKERCEGVDDGLGDVTDVAGHDGVSIGGADAHLSVVSLIVDDFFAIEQDHTRAASNFIARGQPFDVIFLEGGLRRQDGGVAGEILVEYPPCVGENGVVFVGFDEVEIVHEIHQVGAFGIDIAVAPVKQPRAADDGLNAVLLQKFPNAAVGIHAGLACHRAAGRDVEADDGIALFDLIIAEPVGCVVVPCGDVVLEAAKCETAHQVMIVEPCVDGGAHDAGQLFAFGELVAQIAEQVIGKLGIVAALLVAVGQCKSAPQEEQHMHGVGADSHTVGKIGQQLAHLDVDTPPAVGEFLVKIGVQVTLLEKIEAFLLGIGEGIVELQEECALLLVEADACH